MVVDYNDPSWTGEGPEWYETRGGGNPEFRTVGPHMQRVMNEAGVRKARTHREAAAMRGAHYEKLARESTGFDTRTEEIDVGIHAPCLLVLGSDGGLPVQRSRLRCGRGAGVVAGAGFGDDSVA